MSYSDTFSNQSDYRDALIGIIDSMSNADQSGGSASADDYMKWFVDFHSHEYGGWDDSDSLRLRNLLNERVRQNGTHEERL